MHKEQLKNILLVFLVFLNIFLGSKILIDKKLWPDGYNFFSNIGFSKLYTNIISYFQDDSQYKTQVISPEQIIINTGDQTTRISLNPNEEDFSAIYTEANKILKSAFDADEDEISTADVEDIFSALSSDSIYLPYSADYNTALFAGLVGSGNISSNLPAVFSDIVISHTPRTTVYLADIPGENYAKISLSKSSDELTALCTQSTKKQSHDSAPVINYSFDLQFHRPFGSQKTTLNPLIQIYSTVSKYSVINSENPAVNKDLTINEIISDKIVRVFNITPNTMRRHTEAGGTVVFVENDCILKLSPDGYLEYEATGKGIELSKENSQHTAILKLAQIISEVNSAVGNNAYARLSHSEFENTYKFDYIVSGLKINIKNDKISSGVEAIIEDGCLKSYKQLIRNYTVSQSFTTPNEFFKALDDAIAEYSEFMNEIKINKMYVGYTDDGSTGEKNAEWIVDVDNIIVDD